MNEDALTFLSRQHPYDELPAAVLQEIAQRVDKLSIKEGQDIYRLGDALDGLYIVQNGMVSVSDQTGKTGRSRPAATRHGRPSVGRAN